MKRYPRYFLLVCPLFLVAIQFAVYGPALNNGFVHYDDNTYIYENRDIKTLDAQTVSGMFARPFFRSYTPIALLSHAVDYALWAENPFGHHLTSLALHSFNVVLVFFLALALLSKYSSESPGPTRSGLFARLTVSTILGASAAAILYSLHPVRVESVAWISDRKDLLLALFLIPSILAYLKYDELRETRGAVKWFLVALLFNVLALLSKTIATVTPLLLVSLDALLLHRKAGKAEWKSLLLEKAPFFLLSAGFGFLAMWAARGSVMSSVVTHMTSAQRSLLPLYTLAFYPVKYLVPMGLTPIYDAVSAGWMAAAALLTLLVSAGVIWAARKGNTVWLLACLGYALPILPTITGLSAGIQPWADRYTYVPSIAMFVLIGGGVGFLWQRSAKPLQAGVLAAALSVAALFAVMDRHQIAVWKDSETLWRHAVREAPAVPMTYDNLGVALADKGDFDAALEMYRTAARLEPTFADAFYNAAVVFQAKKMPDSALTNYTRAILADTTYVDAYINLGNMLADEGRRTQAIDLYQRALRVDDANADAHYNLGCALYYEGDRQSALESFTRAITYSPSYAKAYYNMGVVYLDLKKEPAALESFVRAARLGSPEARNLLTRQGYTWN